MYQEPTRPAKPLSVIQAEQRNLSNLKNLGVPWVFIQPTRIKKVKIPQNRKRCKNHETFERLGADDLAFLGNAGIELSEAEIKTMVKSYKGTDEDIYASQSSDLLTKSSSAFASDDENFVIDETPKQEPKEDLNKILVNVIKPQVTPENDDDYGLFSGREEKDNTPDIFMEDVKLKVTESRGNLVLIQEDRSEIVKNIIMDNLKQANDKKAKETKNLKFFSFEENNAGNSNDQPSIFDDDSDDYSCRTHSASEVSSGRKKLINFVDSISSVQKAPSVVQKVEKMYKDELDLAKEKLSVLPGVAKFKKFCQETYGKVPEVLQEGSSKPKIVKPNRKNRNYNE